MTDKPDGERWRWARTAWIVPVLILLYVLSIGPTALITQKLRARGAISNDAALNLNVTAYRPILALVRQSNATIRLHHWYKSLWIGPYFGDIYSLDE